MGGGGGGGGGDFFFFNFYEIKTFSDTIIIDFDIQTFLTVVNF